VLYRCDVQQEFNIEVVRSQDNLEEHFVLEIDEFLVPFTNATRLLRVRASICIASGRQGLTAVVLTVLQNLNGRQD
jgi:hypothetical protein